MALFTIATRGSELALTQCSHVAHQLRSLGLDVQLKVITTTGDTSKKPLTQMGGVGVFVAQIRQALLDGEADLAVHSFKDLPTAPVQGLRIGAVPTRADCRDALCARDGLSLRDLPEGATIGTGSPRRAAQLLALRPDLSIVDIRGNVPTRLGRVKGNQFDKVKCAQDLDAVVLARAGLERLDLAEYITDTFGPERLLPAPAQGALAIECRSEDLATNARLSAALRELDHEASHLESVAERAVMSTLEAGCAAPVGTWAKKALLDPSTLPALQAHPGSQSQQALGHTADSDNNDNRTARPSDTVDERSPGLALDATVVATDGSTSVSAMQAVLLDTDASMSEKLEVAQGLGRSVGEELIGLGAGRITNLQATKSR